MIWYFVYALLVLMAAAAALEIYCRIKWRRMALCEDLYSDPHWRKAFPYIMFKGEPDYQHLNEMGYPGPAPEMPKQDGEYRIIIFGGSTVFNGEPSIGGLIEQYCHQSGLPNVRVYNSGVVSSSSGMELSRMLFEFCDRDPDLVIFYNGGNDLLGPHYNDPRPGYPPNFVVHESNPIIQKDVGKYPLWALMLYSSVFLRYWRSVYFKKKFVTLDELRRDTGYRTPAWEDAIIQSYVGNIIKAGKALRGFHTKFIAFFQPVLFFKDAAYIAAEERQHISLQELAYWHSLRQRTVSALHAAAEASGVQAVDISRIFSSDPAWIYTDAIHIHQEMQEVVARRIFEELRRCNLLNGQMHYENRSLRVG
jgi:hypothetical protein